MRCTRTVMLLLLVAGCAGTAASTPPSAPVASTPPAEPAPPKPANEPAPAKPAEEAPRRAEIPADLKEAVELSTSVGKQIYQQEKAAALGTDALVESLKTLEGKGIGGYLAVQDGDGAAPDAPWTVSFFNRQPKPKVLYRVSVPMERGKKPSVETFDPPRAPEPALSTMIKARQAAINAAAPFSQPVNPVVMPAQALKKEGFLVYLLAGTAKPNTMVLGKHFRVLVAPNGKVKQVEPLSKAEMEVPTAASPGAKPAALAVTESRDYPLETHVFASMVARTPIHLSTKRGVWAVDGDSISLMSDQAPPAAK